MNIQSENRKRFNSSMTYDEYIDVYEQTPTAPRLRPKEYNLDFIPEMTLEKELSSPLKMQSSPKIHKPNCHIFFSQAMQNMSSNQEVPDQDYQSPCESLELLKGKSLITAVYFLQQVFYQTHFSAADDQQRFRSRSDDLGFSLLDFLERRIMRKLTTKKENIQERKQVQK